MSRYYYFYKENEDNILTCFDEGRYSEIYYSDFVSSRSLDDECLLRLNLPENPACENPFILILREELNQFEEDFSGSCNQFLFRKLMNTEGIDKMYMEVDV